MEIELTRVSEKGQVVIPSTIRREFHLSKGDQLVVISTGNSIILKRVVSQQRSFDEITKPIREKARELKITRKDVDKAIKEVRSK